MKRKMTLAGLIGAQIVISCVSLPEKAIATERFAHYMPSEQTVYSFIDLKVQQDLSKNFLEAIGVRLNKSAFNYLTRFFAASGSEGSIVLVEHRVPAGAMRNELRKSGFQRLTKNKMYHPESDFHAFFREDYLLEISKGSFERGISRDIITDLQRHTFSLQFFGELPAMIEIPLLQDSFLEKVRIFRDEQNRLQFDIVLTDTRGSRAFVRSAGLFFSGGLSLDFSGSEYVFSVSVIKDNELTLLSEEIPNTELILLVKELFETWMQSQ